MPLEPPENPYVSDVNPVWVSVPWLFGVGLSCRRKGYLDRNAICILDALQLWVWSPAGEVYDSGNRTGRGPGAAYGHVNKGSSRCVLHDEATV